VQRRGHGGAGVVDEHLHGRAELSAETCHFGQEARAVGGVGELAGEGVGRGQRRELGDERGEGGLVAAGEQERVARGERAGWPR
jgi:hypothetical protein